MADVKAKFKVGDRVLCVDASDTDCVVAGCEYVVEDAHDGYVDVNGFEGMYAGRFELVVASSPIRTVTRREIVPGKYGKATVWHPLGRDIVVAIEQQPHSASDLRAAAKLFNEIADVLEERA